MDTEAFAGGTPLAELFLNSDRTKLISVFVDERERDLSISEVAQQAGVAQSTVYDHLDYLEGLEIIKETRETGPSTRYQLNEESEIAEKLYQLDGLVLRKLLELDGEL
ncbi:winged helix-turn-helix domain-containing protein [Halosolutus gelatinilyticus]|uniref:winged helix-turn-helix domain-containing protein n=1 Tax=Halosolutus gelatinilyticus TaxID=2931975 RepID=UPI001FF22507|nr:winged helix-turn-helix domain-containing protein [Halosolutus gelatinilyticus]